MTQHNPKNEGCPRSGYDCGADECCNCTCPPAPKEEKNEGWEFGIKQCLEPVEKAVAQAKREVLEDVKGKIDWILTPHEFESDNPFFEEFASKVKEKYRGKISSLLSSKLEELK